MEAKSIKITKITSTGFGRKINSEYGYSSFEITPTVVEAIIDPALDIATEEGLEEFKKIKTDLKNMAAAMLEADVHYYASRNNELKMTLEKKARLLKKSKESENN